MELHLKVDHHIDCEILWMEVPLKPSTNPNHRSEKPSLTNDNEGNPHLYASCQRTWAPMETHSHVGTRSELRMVYFMEKHGKTIYKMVISWFISWFPDDFCPHISGNHQSLQKHQGAKENLATVAATLAARRASTCGNPQVQKLQKVGGLHLHRLPNNGI